MGEKGATPYSGRRFRSGLRSFVFGRAAQALATAVLLLSTVRLLDSQQYGAYLLVWGLCELAVPLTSLGLLQTVQHYVPRLASSASTDDTRHFVRVMEVARWLPMIAVGFCVAWFWAPLAVWLGLRDAHVVDGVVVALLMVALLGSRFTAELLESLLEQWDAQWVRSLLPVGRLCVLGALWALGQVSLTTLLWADLAVSAMALLLGQWLLARRLRMLQSQGDLKVEWREVRSFVGHMSVSQVLTAGGDAGAVRLVLARVLGVEAVGVFAFLQQLLEMVNRYLPSLLLANVVRPMLVARHAAGDLTMVGAGVALLAKLNMILMLAMLGVVWIGGDKLLSTLSGGAAGQAGLALGVLVIGLLVYSQSQVATMALQVHRRSASITLVSLLAPLTLAFAWWGATRGGLLGAAVGVAASMWLRGGLSVVLLQRSVGRAPLDWPGHGRMALLALASGAVAMAVSHWTDPLAGAALFAFTFAMALVWRCPLNDAEVDLAMRALGVRSAWMRSWSLRR